MGLLEDFRGNRVKALFALLRAMDVFCANYKIKFVEAETSVIPKKIMLRAGFRVMPSVQLLMRLTQFITRQIPYTKNY